jgi:hypothetical protein
VATTAETRRLIRTLRKNLDKVLDATERDLVHAWVRAWDEVAPDLDDALQELLAAGDGVTKAQLLRSERLRKSLTTIAEKLTELSETSKVRIHGDLAKVVDDAAKAQAAIIATQLPAGFITAGELATWGRSDPKAIEAIVKRTTKQVTSLHKPLSAQAYSAVRRELIRGVAAGSHPEATARRILARTQGAFAGGLPRAINISRTETLDAHRAAAQAAEVDAADVLMGWEWECQLSSATCAACLSMSGRIFDLDEPGPNGHQQCRCVRLPVCKPWSELGIKTEEPEQVAKDTEAWFGSLSKQEQVAILGADGHKAWSNGDWPISQWARLKKNPDWRDSWVPAKPPKLAA